MPLVDALCNAPKAPGHNCPWPGLRIANPPNHALNSPEIRTELSSPVQTSHIFMGGHVFLEPFVIARLISADNPQVIVLCHRLFQLDGPLGRVFVLNSAHWTSNVVVIGQPDVAKVADLKKVILFSPQQ